MSVDFVIVGGGIGGAVLAGLLGRGGKKVVVLEKGTAPPQWVRPEVLWPTTAEVLFSLIPREKLEAETMLLLRGVQFHDGQRITPLITPQLLKETQVQAWSTNPNQTRELLLQSDSFELRRGVEVFAVLKEGDRIIGVRTRDMTTAEERDVLAPYTVGDDGANSMIRRACNLEVKTRMFPVDFLCFGFDWPPNLQAATANAWLNVKQSRSGIFALLAVPLPNQKGAGVIVARPKIFDDQPSALSAWDQFRSRDSAINDVIQDREFPNDFMRVRRPWGHVSRYGTEGAVLMGDAAHPVSPAGGQGANMSVADACVLAEIALGNRADLAAEYERRRRPANQRSVGFTRVAASVFGLPDWCSPARLFFSLVTRVARHPSLVRHFLRSASGAFREEKRNASA